MAYCRYCQKEIEIHSKHDKQKKFCNRSCAASFNNSKKDGQSEQTRQKIREGVYRSLGYTQVPTAVERIQARKIRDKALRKRKQKEQCCKVCGNPCGSVFCGPICKEINKVGLDFDQMLHGNLDSISKSRIESLVSSQQSHRCASCSLDTWNGGMVLPLKVRVKEGSSLLETVCLNCFFAKKQDPQKSLLGFPEKPSFSSHQLENLRKIYGPDLRFTSISRIKGRRTLLGYFNGTTKLSLYSRWLMEGELGIQLEKDQTVDHIDGDPTNDSLSNLAVLSREDNARKGPSSLVKEKMRMKNKERSQDPTYREYMRNRPYEVYQSCSKVTVPEVTLIRDKFKNGVTGIEGLMSEYRLSRRTVDNILLGVTFSRISGFVTKEEKRKINKEYKKKKKVFTSENN